MKLKPDIQQTKHMVCQIFDGIPREIRERYRERLDMVCRELTTLAAENERLRKALRGVCNCLSKGSTENIKRLLMQIRTACDTARAALRDAGEGGSKG